MQRSYTIIRTFIAFFFLFLLPVLTFSQSDVSFWTNHTTEPNSQEKSSDALITAHNAEYLTLNYQTLHTKIFSGDLADFTLELPLENGRFKSFTLVDNTLVPSALNEKFPEVRAYNIVSTESRSIWGKFEISPKGIHAMIFQPGKSTFFIDPLYKNNTEQYIAYARKDFYTDKVMDCQVEANPQCSTDWRLI